MKFYILTGVSILIGETCFIFLAINAEELNQYNFCNNTNCVYEPSANYADCRNKKLENSIPPQCSSAEYLDLRKNDLQYIGSTSLSKFTKLKYLYLDGNNIRNITPRAFAECGSLQQLFLQNNPLQIILSEALAGLTNLRQLYLNLAQLKVIHPYAFDDLKALLRLFLSDNSLETLPSNLFQELQNLQILTLANNRLKHLSSDTFQGLIRLEYLDIKQNSLTILPNGLFNNMLILTRLTISYNAIHSIEKGAIDFNQLRNLETLDMRNNSITSVANFSKAMLSISNIYLNNNPLNCSCHDINGLLVWYELHSEFTPVPEQPATCAAPSAFAGMPVQDIMENNFLTCDKITYPSPTKALPSKTFLLGVPNPLPTNALPSKTVLLEVPDDTTTMMQHDVNVVSKLSSVIPDLVTYSPTLTGDPSQTFDESDILAHKNPQNSKTTILKCLAIAILAATVFIIAIIMILIIVKFRRDHKRARSNSSNVNNPRNNQSNDGLYERVQGSESTFSTHSESPPTTPQSPINNNESFPFLQTTTSNPISYIPHSSTHPNQQSSSTANPSQIPDVVYVPHTDNPYAVHIQAPNKEPNQQSSLDFNMNAHNTPTSFHQTNLPSPPIPLPDVQLHTCRCPIQHLPNNNPFCAQNDSMIHIHNNPICA